jgi:hypothetical protein
MSNDPFKPDPTNPLTIQQIQREIENPYAASSLEQYVLHTIRVAIRVKSSDRGEVVEIRPIYEYPLLKRLYARLGGLAEVISVWYPWRDPGETNGLHRRVWKMSKQMIYKQVEDLQKKYRFKTKTQDVDIFSEVYGKNNVRAFADKIRETHAAWINEMKILRAKTPTGFIDLNDETYQRIANMLLPRQESIEDIDIKPVEELSLTSEEKQTFGDVSSPFESDPLFDALIVAGLEVKAANSVMNAINDGCNSEVALRGHNALRSLNLSDTEIAISTWKSSKEK